MGNRRARVAPRAVTSSPVLERRDRLGWAALALGGAGVLYRAIWMTIAFGQPFDVWAGLSARSPEAMPIWTAFAAVPVLHFVGLGLGLASLLKGTERGMGGLVRDVLLLALGRFAGRMAGLAGTLINAAFLGLDIFILWNKL